MLKMCCSSLYNTVSSLTPNHSVFDSSSLVNPPLGQQEQQDLQSFMTKSVTAGTLKGYKAGWEEWQQYLRDRGITDPYLQSYSEEGKVTLLCNLFRTRYVAGKRGKGAYAIGAAIRKFYQVSLQPIAFFESSLATGARTACRLSTDELRQAQREAKGNDKLPVFWEMLSTMRDTHWTNCSWSYPDIDKRMSAMGALLAYELANRGGEATTVGGSAENHTIYNEQCAFRLEEPVIIEGECHTGFLAGSSEFRRWVTLSNVVSCEIGVASHKTGAAACHNVKVIARRNERESELLDDLFEWCIRSGSTSQEPLFSRRVFSGREVTYKKLTPKMMASLIKNTAQGLGLDGKEFSNHSLRKGAVTQMKRSGCRREETNSRGNYSKDSVLVDTVYNHDNTGRGPTGASSSSGSQDVTVADVRRHSKTARFK